MDITTTPKGAQEMFNHVSEAKLEDPTTWVAPEPKESDYRAKRNLAESVVKSIEEGRLDDYLQLLLLVVKARQKTVRLNKDVVVRPFAPADIFGNPHRNEFIVDAIPTTGLTGSYLANKATKFGFAFENLSVNDRFIARLADRETAGAMALFIDVINEWNAEEVSAR